jgi:hypothetical protein
MGPLPIVPVELVSGIGNMRAQGSEEIDCGIGRSAWRVSAGTAVMILGQATTAGEELLRIRHKDDDGDDPEETRRSALS